MSIVYVISLFACNIGIKIQDTSSSVEETDTDTDTDSATNEQNTNETAYTISTNIVGNGVISPVLYRDVRQGETRQFTVMAAEGYEIVSVPWTKSSRRFPFVNTVGDSLCPR